jgi:sigma-B regulation protein RsbU (phosphoserine phosphatase)
MIEPKEFYRKLDSLMSKIGQGKSGKEFLFTTAKELEKTFGNDLHVGKGFVYERNGNEFVLISPLSSTENSIVEPILPMDSEAVQAILNSRTYIFDNLLFTIGFKSGIKKEYTIPAAITVHNQENRWIFIFELTSGWIREEIEFCLNAVRSVLNYRLLSESIKNEYEQAFQIQQSLLPTIPLEIPGYQIACKSQPAELVGGDLYDYFKFDDGEFGFCIGDASGHGIPAALVARDVIIGLRMGIEKHMKMVHTLKKLNKVIYQSVYSTRFISLFYAEMEANGNLFYINAGHPPPFIIYKDEIIDLDSTGLIFGAFPEIDLQRSYTRLKPGGVLVLFSDGIIERLNSKGEEFDLERLKKVVIHNRDRNAEEILTLIFQAAHDYGKGKKWKDDATVVVIKRLE